MVLAKQLDSFPYCDTGNSYDWLNLNDLQKSSISSYLNGFRTNLFRCPTDAAFKELEARTLKYRYPFRYTISYGDKAVAKKRGMASDLGQGESDGLGPFKLSSVVNPSEKIMLAEDASANEYGQLFPVYLSNSARKQLSLE